jgi:hypothetical protein
LLFDKKFGPVNLRDSIIEANYFWFSWALSIDLLLCRNQSNSASSESHTSSSVTLHVNVDGECCIEVPVDWASVIGTHDRDIFLTLLQKIHHFHKLLPVTFIWFSCLDILSSALTKKHSFHHKSVELFGTLFSQLLGCVVDFEKVFAPWLNGLAT